MKVVAVVQARLGSARLPEKVIADIHGKPMIVRVLERVARSQILSHQLIPVVAAVPYTDDALIRVVEDAGYLCCTGPEEDLIQRLYSAACFLDADAIIRITSDCPLVDPATIDNIAWPVLGGRFDYLCNVLPRSFPDGLDVEVYSKDLLTFLYLKTRRQPQHQENFPQYLWDNDQFGVTCLNMSYGTNLAHYRWTVDTQEDLDWVRWVFSELKEPFGMDDILGLLERYPYRVRTG